MVLVGRLARQPMDESQLATTLELTLVVAVALAGFGLFSWAVFGA